MPMKNAAHLKADLKHPMRAFGCVLLPIRGLINAGLNIEVLILIFLKISHPISFL